MRYAIDRLAPEKILLYGDAIPFFDFSGIEVVTYEKQQCGKDGKNGRKRIKLRRRTWRTWRRRGRLFL